ncbi:hypothetical protein [Bdellovibrio svalbardensis]|uniref:Uncharacterized protein n=1 Tax=Bdellovibrio svalbardensis TaxID=2972972 RepID=A0ABT6DHB2_9BACT|nr:hypothetical protein [Bdellovibrio svalbardensis]MDG0815236.1 hypothetical protein [Bdellovibrio svalbardensis]
MKNSTTLLLGFFLLIGVSFASYEAGQKSVSTLSSEASIEEKVKADLVELTKKDFEEYQNLKTMEDRYKKADEILGKIVTVFLADLGLKLSFKPLNPALLEGACAIPGLAPAVTPTPSPAPQQSNMSTPPAATTPTIVKTPAWILNEKRIANMDREEDILRALKQNPIEDLFTTLKSSHDISRGEALIIEGRFQGEIHFFDRKKHKSDWILYWEINDITAQGRTSSSSLITLTEKSNGKTFSRSRGNQMLKNFTRPDGSKALIVNVNDDDGYIQIYPVGGTDQWVGNYYEKSKIGEYNFVGQVTLNRIP